jgi:hypothetical protein
MQETQSNFIKKIEIVSPNVTRQKLFDPQFKDGSQLESKAKLPKIDELR